MFKGSDETNAPKSQKTELCWCCSVKELKWPKNISPWNFGQDKLLRYIPKTKWFVTVQHILAELFSYQILIVIRIFPFVGMQKEKMWHDNIMGKIIQVKERFTQKWKFSHYLLTHMPAESQVKLSKPIKHFWSLTAKQRSATLFHRES